MVDTSPYSPTKSRGIFDEVVVSIAHARAPATTDLKDPRTGKYYKQNTVWMDKPSQQPYILASITNNDANWVAFGTPGPSTLNRLTGDTGGVVTPDGSSNINVLGNSTQGTSTSGNATPNDHTLVVTVRDATTAARGVAYYNSNHFDVTAGLVSLLGTAVATSYPTDSGTATPSGNQLRVLGGEGIDTSGAGNVITIAAELATAAASVGLANIGSAAFDSAFFTVTAGFVSLTGGGFTTNYETDSGTATPSGGVLYVTGGTGINTASTMTIAPNDTVQVNLDVPVIVAHGGTGRVTLTDGAVLVGDGTNPVEMITMTNGQVLIGSTGASPVANTLTAGQGISITNAAGSITIATSDTDVALGVSNLGVSYSASTFSITSANGTALSASNKGYVTIPSKTAGRIVSISVTANQDFIDATGVSQIVGNLFGLTSGRTSEVIPFYIYAVLNDAETAVAFMCSRIPHATVSPAAGFIAQPGTTLATTQGSFFSFEAITAADYESNPCLLVGSFRMTMNTSNDWTVSALAVSQDGIGRFQEGISFASSKGHFGATANKWFFNNGGTAPHDTSGGFTYQIDTAGQVTFQVAFPSITTAGVGAVNAVMAMPFEREEGAIAWVGWITVGGAYTFLMADVIPSQSITSFIGGVNNAATATITNAGFAAGFGFSCNGNLLASKN